MAERGLRLAGLRLPGREPVEALVPPGGLAVVEGPSVPVVSALLAACAGYRRPAAGEVRLDGVALPAGPSTAVRYAGRLPTVLGTLTAVENLVLAGLAARAPAPGGRAAPARASVAAAERELDRFGLGEATWHNLVEQLSGGQQQRVALAQAFAQPAAVLVLDHPTSDLDPANVERVAALVAAARDAGCCCLVASDDPLLTDGVDLLVRA